MSVSNHETSWLYIYIYVYIYIFILEDCWTVNVGYQTGHSIEAGKIFSDLTTTWAPKMVAKEGTFPYFQGFSRLVNYSLARLEGAR